MSLGLITYTNQIKCTSQSTEENQQQNAIIKKSSLLNTPYTNHYGFDDQSTNQRPHQSCGC